MSTKLHVGNIASTVEANDLRAKFLQYGPVETVEIAKYADSGLRKGFAIVAMAYDQDADTAIKSLNFTQYAGRTIGVSRAR